MGEGEVEDHGQAAEALPLQPREVVVVEAEQPQRLQRAQGLAGRRGHPVTAQVELLQSVEVSTKFRGSFHNIRITC